ncbi:F0F1 ATP synthase subunit B [Lactobacillus sp. Sy-1]|uniref:F0F1 ATP synthase subunit B n=1 Tax=Lactobacillus sp. Sy-1 TaxID=2109645 RepID=UPI001C5BC7BD|nr:F0F1 ATP synthase subunit B [Lactobacillus sp. Sy-1]MBW1605841.1 F0F1 ATP synthase subunit B [Lactobacillus sp. Sy-1]
MLSQLVFGAELAYGTMLYYLVLFLVLVLLIKVFAWKPINKMLNERTQQIVSDIDSAKQKHQEADSLAKQRQDELNKSHDEASTIITNAKQAGQKQQEQIVSDAQSDAQTIKDNAHKSIEQERQDVLANTKNDVANLSIEIASKIIQKELKANDQKALIDSYIEGLGKQNESR